MTPIGHLAALAYRAALRHRLNRTTDGDERTKLNNRLQAVKKPVIKTAKNAKEQQRNA